MARRSNGEGSIYKSGGKWKVELTVGKTPSGRPRRTRRTAKSKADAIAILNELQSASRSASLPPIDVITVDQYLTNWLEFIRHERAAKTHESYAGAVRNHLAPRIGGFRLQALSPLHVESALQGMRDDKVGSRTVQNAYVVLRAAMNRAVSMGLIARNPCAVIERPKHRRSQIEPFSTEEVAAVLGDLATHRVAGLFVLAFTVGMRAGELLGLTWEHVDIGAGTVRIRQQAVESGGSITLAPLKTKSSRRNVELTAAGVEALRMRQAVAMREGLAAGELVFPTRAGTFITKTNLARQIWKPALQRCDIRPRGLHHARHTYATTALTAGVPLHVVSGILGHASPSTTLAIYSHYLQQQQSLSRDVMQRLFG